MRVAFIETLTELAATDRDIILLSGDLGFSVLEGFAVQYPRQFINCGVAEQNMMGMAAGLAMTGKKPFVYSIIPFVTMRVYEQLRNDICLQNLNVKIVGLGAGLSYGVLGPTHHAIEDIAITRTLPNLSVVSPADPIETRLAVNAIAKRASPAYLRLGKSKESVIHSAKPSFAFGAPIIMRRGKDVLLLATGPILRNVLQAAEILSQKGIRPTIVSVPFIKPLDKKKIFKLAGNHKVVVTIEEHHVDGGFGDLIATTILESGIRVRFARVGITDRFVKEVGSQEYLREVSGLAPQNIYERISSLLAK